MVQSPSAMRRVKGRLCDFSGEGDIGGRVAVDGWIRGRNVQEWGSGFTGVSTTSPSGDS